MAKLSAHGSEIGTIYTATRAYRYMSDGKILQNVGFGWKLGPKLKPGVDVREAFERRRARQVAEYAARPCFAAYVKELHDLAGLSKRWKLNAAVAMMPDDADGVWSEACDGYGDNCSADVDEVGHLCMLYRNAVRELNEMKAASGVAMTESATA